jgi:membrane-associated phospholipid phosphatase
MLLTTASGRDYARTMSVRSVVIREGNRVIAAFLDAVGRLDKSTDPNHTVARLRRHTFTPADSIYILHVVLALGWFTIMDAPFYVKLGIPALFTTVLLIPFTSQFFFRAIPVFAWLLTLFCSRFIPHTWRPTISVVLLPTLETVLYGANISDILTRYTHPILDCLAVLPYGVLHFILPFVVAAFLWLFRPKEALHLWARTFGYMNMIGVWCQILFPCAPPWYEIIYGLTPADYDTRGSAGGLMRIDHLLGTAGYQNTFGASPLVFGALPSLHAACGTLEALFISHFFPQATRFIWTYVAILFWSTMYLSHHYLIDVVVGACFATAAFHLAMPAELSGAAATMGPGSVRGARGRGKYALYENGNPSARGDGMVMDAAAADMASDASDEETDIAYAYRAPHPPAASLVGPPPARKSHRHTASVASLIREGERVEDGWSPIGGSFSFPPTPTRSERDPESGVEGRP